MLESTHIEEKHKGTVIIYGFGAGVFLCGGGGWGTTRQVCIRKL